jgi:hypothetical protein
VVIDGWGCMREVGGGGHDVTDMLGRLEGNTPYMLLGGGRGGGEARGGNNNNN